MSTPEAQRWALAYASLGWRVFPVVHGAKRPLFKGWQPGATSDPKLIRQYWRTDAAPNVGITGEAFVAFDIEAAHFPVLGAWMRDRELRMPVTPIARSGRGGIHVFVRTATSMAGRTLRLDGIHIGELKTGRGFIVACPSRTVGQYTWLRSPLDTALVDPSDWLLELVSEPAPRVTSSSSALSPSRAVAVAAGLHRVVAEARPGQRNAILFWAACRAAEHGLEPAAAAEILLAGALDAVLVAVTAQRCPRRGPSSWHSIVRAL
jgi:hypothetical protein